MVKIANFHATMDKMKRGIAIAKHIDLSKALQLVICKKRTPGDSWAKWGFLIMLHGQSNFRINASPPKKKYTHQKYAKKAK